MQTGRPAEWRAFNRTARIRIPLNRCAYCRAVAAWLNLPFAFVPMA